MKEIFTIGHSNYSMEGFVGLLKRFQINCIADVRSVPYSRYTPQYNAQDVKNALKNHDILYIFLGKELGARREDKELYTPEGYLDFEKASKTNLFQSAIERLQIGIDKGFKIALMCMEKDPIDCHRNIMVARQFHENKYKVSNILADASSQSQDYIEQRLLDLYFPNRMQQVLFENCETSNKLDLIVEAYRFRNKDIAYYLKRKESVVY